MTVSNLHPDPSAPRRPVTYAEPVIHDAALQAGESLNATIAAITANDIAAAREAGRSLDYWLGRVAEMRQFNERAEIAKVKAAHRQGLITDDECEQDIARMTVLANRITQD